MHLLSVNPWWAQSLTFYLQVTIQEGSSFLCFLGNKNQEFSYLPTLPWTVNKIHGKKKHCAGFTESAVQRLQQQPQPGSPHPGMVQVRNHLLPPELSPSYTRTNNSHCSCGSSHSSLKGESKAWHQTQGCSGPFCPVSRNTPGQFFSYISVSWKQQIYVKNSFWSFLYKKINT